MRKGDKLEYAPHCLPTATLKATLKEWRKNLADQRKELKLRQKAVRDFSELCKRSARTLYYRRTGK